MKVNFSYITKLIVYGLCLISFNSCEGLCQTAGKEEQKNNAAAHEETFIATIDLATVYALHPMMNYYDSGLNLFIKPAPKGVTHDEFLSIISERRKEYNKNLSAKSSEIKKIKGEIESVWQEIKKSGSKKLADFDLIEKKFNPLVQSTTNQVEIKKLLVQRAAASKEFYDKYDLEFKNKKKKLSGLLDAQEKIQSSLLLTYYLSPEETSKQFEEINADIKDAVKIAAKKNNVKAVLNFNMLNANSEKKQTAEKGLAEKRLAASELETLLNEGPDYSKTLEALKVYESIDAANSNVDAEKFLVKISPAGDLASKPFITRGKDLTWFTIITLMVKNGIPKEKAEAVSEVISDIYKIDNE